MVRPVPPLKKAGVMHVTAKVDWEGRFPPAQATAEHAHEPPQLTRAGPSAIMPLCASW
jgi:hypothetical protein